jgi:septum formation protein
MSPAPLILASASPSRRQMLLNAGLDFEIVPSGVDEDEVKRSLLAERASAQDIATTLAEMKALRVSARRPGAMVIGADSTLACDGKLYDKPATLAAARAQLMALGGRTHELVAYLARAGQAVCASVGAYQLEGLGAHLFSRIEGDYFTVLGLPLLPLLVFLAEHDIGLERAA